MASTFTDLPGAGRVSKADPIMDALGSLDELSAALGLLRTLLRDAFSAGFIVNIQRQLLEIGGEWATGIAGLDADAIRHLEQDIARLHSTRPPADGFILPGANESSARAHWARAVCRRAERDLIRAGGAHPGRASGTSAAYLNRLSAWLFALARAEEPADEKDG